MEELTQETRLVPKEVWEDEPVERTEYRIVTEERKIPQVKALYPFQGQDMQVVKGEVRHFRRDRRSFVNMFDRLVELHSSVC